MIEEHIFICKIPVIRQIAIIVITHVHCAVLIPLIQGIYESVHFSLVILHLKCAQTVIQIIDGTIPDMKGFYTFSIRFIEGIDRDASSGLDSIGTWIGAKIIVKCMILLH